MKVRLIIATSILLLGFATSEAQKKFVPEKQLTTESNSLNYKLPGKQYYNTYIPSGTIFLNNEWQDGYLILKNGDRYDNVSLKYNTFLDELIHINNRTVSMIMLDKNTIAEFGFYRKNSEPQSFTKMTFTKTPKGEYFFNTLYSGKLKLVVWYRSIEEQTTLYKDNYGKLQNTRFNLYTNYYIIFPGNDFERFRLKRRSFIDLFPDNKKDVRRILRKNHITFSYEEQTIQAVRLVEEALYSDL